MAYNFAVIEDAKLREAVKELSDLLDAVSEGRRGISGRLLDRYQERIVERFSDYLETLHKEANKRAKKQGVDNKDFYRYEEWNIVYHRRENWRFSSF